MGSFKKHNVLASFYCFMAINERFIMIIISLLYLRV